MLDMAWIRQPSEGRGDHGEIRFETVVHRANWTEALADEATTPSRQLTISDAYGTMRRGGIHASLERGDIARLSWPVTVKIFDGNHIQIGCRRGDEGRSAMRMTPTTSRCADAERPADGDMVSTDVPWRRPVAVRDGHGAGERPAGETEQSPLIVLTMPACVPAFSGFTVSVHRAWMGGAARPKKPAMPRLTNGEFTQFHQADYHAAGRADGSVAPVNGQSHKPASPTDDQSPCPKPSKRCSGARTDQTEHSRLHDHRERQRAGADDLVCDIRASITYDHREGVRDDGTTTNKGDDGYKMVISGWMKPRTPVAFAKSSRYSPR